MEHELHLHRIQKLRDAFEDAGLFNPNQDIVETIYEDAVLPFVEEIAKWLQHIDRLDEIPGATLGLPEYNVLWDAAEAIRQRFGGG